MTKHTWESLFNTAWPDVPVEDASESDKRLFSDHHIERQVREQVAREIEAMFVHSTVPGEAEVIREVKAEAARIARGEG